MPQMERAYTKAIEAGDKKKAGAILGEFTAGVVASAGAMLDEQLAAAADGLGLNAVPDDDELSAMIEDATAEYALHGPHQESQGI